MTGTKTLIKVTIHLSRPWAVGTVRTRAGVDLPTMVDPRVEGGHQPYLPATSLVGPLRVHLGSDLAGEWLGPEPHAADDADHDKRVASRLWALGTRLLVSYQLDEFPTTRVDAQRGSADEGSLRVQQRAQPEAPDAAATLDWYLTADEGVPREVVDKLGTWQFFVGRGRGTGHGLARVVDVRVAELDLTDPKQLTWWLTSRHAWMAGTSDELPVDPQKPPKIESAREFPQLTYQWRVEEPIAVGADVAAERPDSADGRTMVPRTLRKNGADKPIIPGSSWRGVFRHRLEFILTAVGLEACDPDRTEIVEYLFGQASHSQTGKQRGRRGALRFLESTFEPPQGSKDVLERSHVAIDRITGGAAPGLLFKVTAVRPDSTCTLTMESDKKLDDAYQNLLNHVARDINDGLIGVGGMATRGYGSLELTDDWQPEPIKVEDLRLCAARLRAARAAQKSAPEADMTAQEESA